MRTRIRPRRAGFSLLELVAVLVGVGFLMAASTVLVIGAFRIKDSGADVFERQGQRMLLFDQFRADVAQAVEAPERVDQVAAGPACLILRRPDGKHVVYRHEGNRLERWERSTAGGAPLWIPLDPAGVTAEFRRGGSDNRLVTLRLTQTGGRSPSKRPLDVTAALGGDLR